MYDTLEVRIWFDTRTKCEVETVSKGALKNIFIPKFNFYGSINRILYTNILFMEPFETVSTSHFVLKSNQILTSKVSYTITNINRILRAKNEKSL